MNQSVTIIACGESGSQWDGTGDSIGGNDCFKFGHNVDYLMVIDAPKRFTPERQDTILSSTPRHFLSTQKGWLRQFHDPQVIDNLEHSLKYDELYCTNGPELIRYRFSRWPGRVHKDRIQYSKTSPFAAISLAYNLGYKEITLYGADFKTHKTWNPTNDIMKEELKYYRAMIAELHILGVYVEWINSPL